MTYEQMDKIVKHQLQMSLDKRELTINDIGTIQYKDELYQMAINLLIELKGDKQ